MNKRPFVEVEVDEDQLRDAMLQVPIMHHRRPAGAMALLGEAVPEETASGPSAPESPAVAAAPEAGDAQAEPARPEPAKRGPYRKKRPEDEQAYRDLFLVNDGVRSRVTAAIDRDIHVRMKALLVLAAPEVSIVSYISNVLAYHLEQFEDVIDKLYEKPLSKLRK
jgi:hypothetical protein